MAKKRHYESVSHLESQDYYSGEKARRRMEMEDGGMIYENNSAVANLPQEVIMRPYPKAGGYLPEDLDDTIRGVDGQMNLDNAKRRANFMPKKV